MILFISWSSYWQFIALSVLIYYISIVSIYYRDDLLKFIRSYSSSLKTTVFTNSSIEDSTADHSRLSTKDFSKILTPAAIDRMLEAIRSILHEAADKSEPRGQILFSLHQVLHPYYGSVSETFVSSINNYIISECQRYGSIQLEADDLRGIWVR